jgi:hypothetical protein
MPLGDESFIATEVTDPDEHSRLYALAERVYTGYGGYRAKTAPVGRKIPVFRLEPRKSNHPPGESDTAGNNRPLVVVHTGYGTMVPTRNRQGWR